MSHVVEVIKLFGVDRVNITGFGDMKPEGNSEKYFSAPVGSLNSFSKFPFKCFSHVGLLLFDNTEKSGTILR